MIRKIFLYVAPIFVMASVAQAEGPLQFVEAFRCSNAQGDQSGIGELSILTKVNFQGIPVAGQAFSFIKYMGNIPSQMTSGSIEVDGNSVHFVSPKSSGDNDYDWEFNKALGQRVTSKDGRAVLNCNFLPLTP